MVFLFVMGFLALFLIAAMLGLDKLGLTILFGLGIPCLLAAYYYAWDLRNRDNR
jgi:hypothetical protein